MARSVADLALLWTLVERRLHPERAADLARRSEAIVAGEWRPQARSLGDSATRNRGCPDQRRGWTGNSFVQRHGWAPPRLAVIEEYFFEEGEASALDAFKACIARLEEAGAAIERIALPASFAGMHTGHRMVMAVETAQVQSRGFRGPARDLPSGDHAAHRGGAVGLRRRLPRRAGPAAALRGGPPPPPSMRRPRRWGRRRQRGRSSPCPRRRYRARRRSPSRAPGTRGSTRCGRSADCRRAGCRPAWVRTDCRWACNSARLANPSRCSRPRPGAKRSWRFPVRSDQPPGRSGLRSWTKRQSMPTIFRQGLTGSSFTQATVTSRCMCM